MTPIRAIAVIRSMSNWEGEITPSQALLDLADVLAAYHGAMADEDWEVLATVGIVLWRLGFAEHEAGEEVADLIAKVRRRK